MRVLDLPTGWAAPGQHPDPAGGSPPTRSAALRRWVETAPDAESRATALIEFALWCADAEPARAVALGAQAVEAADRCQNPWLAARARYADAVARLSAKQDFVRCDADLLTQRQRFVDLGAPADAALCELMAGVAREFLGDTGGAVVLYERALETFRRHGHLAGEARCLNSIGFGEHYNRRPAEALRQFRRAADLARKAGCPGTYGLAQLNGAEACTTLGEKALEEGAQERARHLFEEASAQFRQLWDFAERVGYLRLTTGIAAFQAVNLLHLGQWDEAVAEADRALRLGEASGCQQAWAMARSHAGLVQLAVGSPATARELLTAALADYEQWGLHAETARMLRGLVAAHEQLGDVPTAYALHKRLLTVELASREASARRENQVLAARAEAAQGGGADQAELARANVRLETERRVLERLALTDPLTGLANRRHFDAQLPRLAVRAELSRRPLGLLLVDLDHFKAVNDRVSHAAGDAVLRRVGEAIAGQSRFGDLVARVGGEEFAVLLPGTPLEEALAVAERVRRTVAATSHDDVLPGLSVTVSVGVAVAEPGESTEGLLVAADAALYEAKRQGRDRVCAGNRTTGPPGRRAG